MLLSPPGTSESKSLGWTPVLFILTTPPEDPYASPLLFVLLGFRHRVGGMQDNTDLLPKPFVISLNFETGSHQVTQAALEFAMLLPQSPKKLPL